MFKTPIQMPMASLVALRQAATAVEVLLLRRATTLAGAWCQVAGGIEAGETAWQAAVRELAEETGLRPEALYSADFCEQFYEPDLDAIVMAPVFVAFVAADAEVVLNPEHDDYRWVGFDAAVELVSFGGQRTMLRWIEAEFVCRAPSPHLRIALPSEELFNAG